MTGRASWRPPSDGELTWFRPGPVLLPRPRPLDFSLATQAFAFGVSRALESLYLPLSEVRARLFEGELYLAVVPSAIAERDPAAHKQRMCDSALRFSRDIRAAWQRIRPEVDEYQRFFEGFATADASSQSLAEELPRLKRVRANQWFAPVRAIAAPTTLLLYEGIGQTPRDEALAVAGEMRQRLVQDGAAALDGALLRVGQRLAAEGAIEQPEDVFWLDLAEVRRALQQVGRSKATVAKRRTAFAQPRAEPAETIGPALAADEPRMYLIHEMLALLASGTQGRDEAKH